MLGQTVSHYRILEELGTGGMGAVYKAEDTRLKRKVALKFLPSETSANDDAKQRFIQEACAASALQHNNICSVHDIEEMPDGRMFICMDYYEGETLREKLARGPLPVKEALEFTIQVAAGLAKAHESGIVHRDIKPANVIITRDGTAKIVDFGLVKLDWGMRLTRTGSTLGTVLYMAPEQAMGQEVDHRSDLWSIGVVLYELLAGEPPFQGDHPQSVIYQLLNESPRPLRTRRPDAPEELTAILDKALKRDVAERFQSAAEFIAALKGIGSGESRVASAGSARTDTPSIAVLPFVNLTAQPESEYFGDGLAENIISALTKIQDLRVVARTSAFAFRNREADVREVGRRLHVEHVLEGSVRQSGERLRITAQLVSCADGFHVWSEQFDRVVDDVFGIQDEIALAIVDRLKGGLLRGEEIAVVKHATENRCAFDFYLRGLFCQGKRTEESMKRSVGFFEEALREDPDYGLAYAGLANTYNMLGAGDYGVMRPDEAFPKARRYAEQALRIDESLAEAYTALAWARAVYDWDLLGSERAYRRAIQLNPGHAMAHHWYSILLVACGRAAEAIREVEKAKDLDPISLIIHSDLAWVRLRAGDVDGSIDRCLKALEIDPDYSVLRWNLGQSYAQKGRHEDAIRELRAAVDLSGRNLTFLAALGNAYAIAGVEQKARDILSELEELAARRYVLPHLFAIVHVGLREFDEAFEWLEKARLDRTDFVLEARIDPRFADLIHDPRFDAFIERAGFDWPS